MLLVTENYIEKRYQFILRFSEPVKLVGEGKYNIDAVKEIKATESYMGMDMKYRGCQDEEPLEDCTAKHYIDTLLHQCECLPLRIATSTNVINILNGLEKG